MLVRVAPFLGLCLLTVFLGYQFADLVPVADRLYLELTFVGLLLAVFILDKEPGWNLVLLICFGMTAGMMLFWSSGGQYQQRSWMIFTFLFSISLVGGYFKRSSSGQVVIFLSLSTFLFMAGWIIIAISSLPDIVGMIWTVLGLLLNTLILICMISNGKNQNDEVSAIPYAILLFVVIFNLCWLSSLV